MSDKKSFSVCLKNVPAFSSYSEVPIFLLGKRLLLENMYIEFPQENYQATNETFHMGDVSVVDTEEKRLFCALQLSVTRCSLSNLTYGSK